MSPKAVFVLLGVFGVAVLASAEAPVPTKAAGVVRVVQPARHFGAQGSLGGRC